MNLKHLLIFIEVASCKKMSLAAKKLSMTQPAVSKAILDLEEYYNVKLFERYPRELCITDIGKLFLVHAKRITNLCNILEETMKSSNYIQPIQIGVTITIGNFFLEKILNTYKGRDKLKVLVNNTNKIEEKLLANELDLGIVEGIVKSNHLIVKPIQEDRLILVCGKNHKYFERDEEITLQELQYESLIMREQGSGTRDIFVKYVEDRGYSLNIGWECSETSVIIKGVINNYGITVISECWVQEELDQGKLKVIKLKDFNLTRTFNLVYHKNKLLSQNLRELINELSLKK